MEIQPDEKDEIVSFYSIFLFLIFSYLRLKLQDLFLDYRLVNKKTLLKNIKIAFAHASRNLIFFLNSKEKFCLSMGKKTFLDFFKYAMHYLRLKEKKNPLLANNLILRKIRLIIFDSFIEEFIKKQTKFTQFLRWLKRRRESEASKSIPGFLGLWSRVLFNVNSYDTFQNNWKESKLKMTSKIVIFLFSNKAFSP